LKIRTAVEEDAIAIATLILTTAASQLQDEFTAAGWLLFKNLLAEETQRELIGSKRYRYWVALADSNYKYQDRIVGVLSVKENSHLFHLFVSPDWQGRGVGKKLWDYFLNTLEFDIGSSILQKSIYEITVNASTFAIPFYLKLGFIISQPTQIKKGVTHTPMIISLAKNNNNQWSCSTSPCT